MSLLTADSLPVVDAVTLASLSPEDLVELRRLRLVQSLRNTTYPALNGQGFIRLVDCYGTDDRIVGAARLTAQSVGKTFSDDRTLLRYLMRHRHTTPIEFCELTLHIRVPMDCWRQWIRHRTASVNEFSTRYSHAIDEKATTPPDKWRMQSKGNRQGSSGAVVNNWDDVDSNWELPGGIGRPECHPGAYLSAREQTLHNLSDEVYHERLAFGVAKEVARKDLPLSTFTEAYWKIDLHNLLHFLGLRMDSHAQQEIREYADIVGKELVSQLFPVTWEAFQDYHLNSLKMTTLDIGVCRRLSGVGGSSQREFLVAQPDAWASLERCRERVECWNKLTQLGICWYDPTQPDIT